MDKVVKTISATAGAILTYLFGGWSALLGILLNNITYPIAYDLEDKSQRTLGKKVLSEMIDAFCSEVALSYF